MDNTSCKNKSKIKIFVDAHVFDGINQGTVSFLSGLYSEIVKDTRFKLFVGSNNRAKAERLIRSSNFIHLQYNSRSRIKRLLIIIPRLLRSHKIDIAHFQYILPLIKPSKFIVTVHDLIFLDYPKSFPLSYKLKNFLLFYISCRRADLITTVSSYSRKSIIKHFNISKKTIQLTPNAVSLQGTKDKSLNALKNRKFILYVSRIEPRKNQALLIDIWKELSLFNNDISLVLVGADGVKDSKFNTAVKNLSPTEKKYFFWLQNVSDSELIWLYKNCELFVYPSIAEGFGIPPLEAALNGAKVLCSNKTAMEDFSFFDNFLFSPENKQEFKNKIIWAMSNQFRHNYVIQEIKKRYNWSFIAENFVNEIIKVYELQ